MDLIDKIYRLQYYSTLPFGEIYEDSMIFNNVTEFKITHEHFNSSTITLDNSYVNVEPIFSFRFEVPYESIRRFETINKHNIIVKVEKDYYLLQNTSSLLFNRLRNSLDDFFPVHYNYTETYRTQNMIYTNKDTIVITGYATEIAREPVINSLRTFAEQIINY